MPTLKLFLCGDVMTGRGVDQVLPHPGDPEIRESYVVSARRYVQLAETANGPLPAPVGFSYIWGDALSELEAARPDVRIVNLETSITTSREFWPKGINYRMNPPNVPCLGAAGIDCCSLANNHVLDFGYTGLSDTIETLRRADIAVAGAGADQQQARIPAAIRTAAGNRVLVFAFGSVTSGIPMAWAAGPSRPGVNLLRDLSIGTAEKVAAAIVSQKQPGDIVVASIHWGENWGYGIAENERAFAHALIGSGGVDVVHGHSSHHPKAIEVYRGKLILYGCGDFIDDYEGIEGYEAFRDDLVLMYLPEVEVGGGRLIRLELIPFQIKNFRLNRIAGADVMSLAELLNREGGQFGSGIDILPTDALELSWR